MVSATNAVWYILVYGTSAIILLGRSDWRLASPIAAWFACYALFLRFFVPRMRERSRRVSEARSTLTGRVVDSYTNILTVKLFARARDEDGFVREALDDHTALYRRQLRMLTGFVFTLAALNACMVVGTGGTAIALWATGRVPVGIVATALPMAWQIANMAGWVAQNVTAIFENIGVVQDGMRSISVPRQMPDAPGAGTLRLTDGAIRFEHVGFDYGRIRSPRRGGVLHDFDLAIAPGERVGVVGRSGAGKSTLVNLLLHFHAPERGRILIDGQDITTVTQESLRAQIGMVTQDTSLLHRSIRDNIRYGRPEASEDEIRAAAAQAHALDFIESLEDWNGRPGFDAHVGERGVKLSGGQRQRIAIARVILKDAPILVLDEATSALDFGGGSRHPGTAHRADGGPHGDRHRPPPLHDRPDGPPHRARRRPHRRTRHPQHPARQRRPLRRSLAPPVRRVPARAGGDRGLEKGRPGALPVDPLRARPRKAEPLETRRVC